MSRQPLWNVKDESGFSLTELLIASFVMILITTALFTSLESTEVMYEDYSADIDLRQQARVALSQFADEARMLGYGTDDSDETLTVATDDQFQFIGDIDDGDDSGACDSAAETADGGGIERITYAFDSNAGTLSRQVDCYDGSSWTNAAQTNVLLGGLHADGLLFRYFDATGAQLPSGGGTLSSSERADVRSVSIEVALDDDAADALLGNDRTDLSMSSRVKLQNRAHAD